MKYSFFWIISIFIVLVSCEKPENNVGLELQPEDENLGMSYDSSTVLMKTIYHDSLSTTSLTTSLLGEMDDPVIGLTQASVYIQPRLNNTNVNFDAGAALDSLVLSIAYSGEYYGELDPMSITVQPISELFSQDSTYYSYSVLSVTDTNLVDPMTEFVFNVEDDVTVGGTSEDPQLRLNLFSDDYDLGTELLDPDNEAFLDDNSTFTDYLKGFRIEAKKISGNGGLVYLDLFSDYTKMTLYYHIVGGEDSLHYEFPITVSSPKFVNFSHEYNTANVTPQLDTDLDTVVQQYEEVYLQSTNGLGLEVRLPDLFDIGGGENITINRAYLEMPIVEDNLELYKPNTRLKAFIYNDEGEQINIPDAYLSNYGSLYTDGYYDEDNHVYRLTLTRFVQQVLTGEISDPTFVIFPELSRTLANRAIIKSSINSSDQKTKLIINYTTY